MKSPYKPEAFSSISFFYLPLWVYKICNTDKLEHCNDFDSSCSDSMRNSLPEEINNPDVLFSFVFQRKSSWRKKLSWLRKCQTIFVLFCDPFRSLQTGSNPLPGCTPGIQHYRANDTNTEPKSGLFSAVSHLYWYNGNYGIHHWSCVELYVLHLRIFIFFYWLNCPAFSSTGWMPFC